MKINSSDLLDFVKKCSLDGTIPTGVWEFTPDGILSKTIDSSNTTLSYVLLNSNGIEDYSQLETCYIRDTPSLIKHLQSFGNTPLDVTISNNVLDLKGENREAHIILSTSNLCENVYTKALPKVVIDAEFEVEKKVLEQATKDMTNLKEMEVIIEKVGSNITFKVGEIGQTDTTITKIQSSNGKNTNVRIGNMLASVVKVIDGKVKMGIGTNSPITIVQDSDKIHLVCFIAPRSDE